MTLGQNNRVSGCILVVEHLPPMSKALGVILSTEKPNKQRGEKWKDCQITASLSLSHWKLKDKISAMNNFDNYINEFELYDIYIHQRKIF